MGLLVEFDNLHDCLGILFLLLTGDTRLLKELLPLLWHSGELAHGQVEAKMHEMDWVIWDRDFRTFGRGEEV